MRIMLAALMFVLFALHTGLSCADDAPPARSTPPLVHMVTERDLAELADLGSKEAAGFNLQPGAFSKYNEVLREHYFLLGIVEQELEKAGLTREMAIRRINAQHQCFELAPLRPDMSYECFGAQAPTILPGYDWSLRLLDQGCLTHELWQAQGGDDDSYIAYLDAFIAKELFVIRVLQRMPFENELGRIWVNETMLSEVNDDVRHISQEWRGEPQTDIKIVVVRSINGKVGGVLPVLAPVDLDDRRLLNSIAFTAHLVQPKPVSQRRHRQRRSHG